MHCGICNCRIIATGADIRRKRRPSCAFKIAGGIIWWTTLVRFRDVHVLLAVQAAGLRTAHRPVCACLRPPLHSFSPNVFVGTTAGVASCSRATGRLADLINVTISLQYSYCPRILIDFQIKLTRAANYRPP